MNFSVLMSVYKNETADNLQMALNSIYYHQTVKPTEIILVQDGPLGKELHDNINEWKLNLSGIIKIVALESNVGLGDALCIGLEHCTNELVARMDTDDIANPQRFEKQLLILENEDIDICGSWVTEFDGLPENIVSSRVVPEHHNEIKLFSKKMNPINHPSVMYRKTAVISVGSYQKMMWFEDYFLWIRLIMANARFYNIQEPLVNMRAGFGQLERRRGWNYGLKELDFQRKFFVIGGINIFQFIRNITFRFLIRLLPKNIVKSIYKKIRTIQKK